MHRSKRFRVLVIDDTPANIYQMLSALKDRYSVIAATSGEKGLALARAEPPPDLILLDVIMNGLSGYEVQEQLQQDARTARIPVIFVSALSEEDDEARGLTAGAVDYISKPFHPSIVRARVKNHLDLKHHRDHLEHLVAQQVTEIVNSHVSTILALSKLAESRDDDTGQHLERTRFYCKVLTEELMRRRLFPREIDEAFLQGIAHASALHDIGKVAIPDAILRKRGKLTQEEFEIMKTHTTLGAQSLQQVAANYPHNQFLQMGLQIARSHHERWDGSGYPEGLKGEQIPLAARVMAIADVYDALRSPRSYKEAWSHERARSTIMEGRGSHFDPTLVDCFLELEAVFEEMSRQEGSAS